MKSQLLSVLALLPIAFAIPTKRQDTTEYCGQWDTATEGDYELLLDQWGISGATGSQCAQVTSLSGSNIAWTTTWTWTGGSGVKSFTNIQLNQGINKQLSAISSMPVRFFRSSGTSSFGRDGFYEPLLLTVMTLICAPVFRFPC